MIKIDESFTLLNDVLRGRKPKFKLIKDGATYIYKYGAINNEIWAELISEQLGLQAGIDMAHYELATYGNTIGLLTPSFLKPGQLIVSCDNLKANMQSIYGENNISINISDHTIENIVNAACTFDTRIKEHVLTFDLLLRWAFYGLIMESDKNETNIAFIKGVDGFTLTPDYDNSSMASLNKNIANILDSLRHGYSIYSLTDSIKSSFKISKNDTGYFLQDFESFAKNYPAECAYCIARLSNINVDLAFERVEQINNVEIPWEIKYWVSKLINSRLQDMQSIYDRVRENSNQVILKK